MPAVSQRIKDVQASMAPFMRFFSDSAWARRDPESPDTCDFVFGNPHEMPLPDFVGALEKSLTPQNQHWFGYKTNEPEPREIVAQSLSAQRKMAFAPEDIFLTNGAFAALSVAVCALTDPGDELIFISPPWFFYEPIITSYNAKPVRVKVDPDSFDLDLGAIAAAINERTRAIIINSPNNPTGKIYPPETLQALARLLEAASERFGKTIYLLSDEAYSRIVFDGQDYPSPTGYYPHSLLLYTYGKTLLTPGQRIGYIALPPSMPEREAVGEAIVAAQFVTGFAFPNALLQHALADLEPLSIDIAHLQRKRDLLVGELRSMGYELHVPEGTFYLLVKSPLADDLAFMDMLAEHKVYCLPGTVVELPGTFRISLTANDEMIRRALPAFAAAMQEVKKQTQHPA